MVFITVKRGFDIPSLQEPAKRAPMPKSSLRATDLSVFSMLRLKVLVKPGDLVAIGEPLVEERGEAKRVIVSLCSGVVKEIRRGLRRQPTAVIIEKRDGSEKALAPIDIEKAQSDQIIERMLKHGLFTSIRMRPFDLPAHPNFLPKAIFIKALDKAPGALSPEVIVEGNEALFDLGLQALQKIAPEKVHLVRDEASSCETFKQSLHAHTHSVEGPFPACLPSIHIAHISPIRTPKDITWTLDVRAVIAIGKSVAEGKCLCEHHLLVSGPNRAPVLFFGEGGVPIQAFIEENNSERTICPNPLTGSEKGPGDFVPHHASSLYFIPEDHDKRALHFMRLSSNHFSSMHLFKHSKKPLLTTNQHGEERAFIDGTIYDRVMPLAVPTMPLVKAVMARDFEKAIELGLLEVAGEDFALPTFVCPSKIEMVDIITSGLLLCASEMG